MSSDDELGHETEEKPEEVDLSELVIIGAPKKEINAAAQLPTVEEPPAAVDDPRQHTEESGHPAALPALDATLIIPGSDSGRAQKKEQPDAGALIAGALAPQLGSAPEFTGRQKIDERKLAVLNEMIATALGYFGHRGYKDGVGFYQWLVDWELVISQAINGLGRQHILKALVAGAGQQLTDFAQRPNILARNLTNRNWRADAAREGKIVLDEE